MSALVNAANNLFLNLATNLSPAKVNREPRRKVKILVNAKKTTNIMVT